jgi:hypothetical protein
MVWQKRVVWCGVVWYFVGWSKPGGVAGARSSLPRCSMCKFLHSYSSLHSVNNHVAVQRNLVARLGEGSMVLRRDAAR